MKKINRLIQRDLTDRLQRTDAVITLIEQFLNIPLENRLWLTLKNQRLTLLTDDAHLATHLRFQHITLCRYINKHLDVKIRAVDIKVISLPLARFEQKTSGFSFSHDAANVICSIAQSIDDPELREAVVQLAQTASQPSRLA